MGLSGTPITPVDSTPDIYPPLTGSDVSAADVQSGEQAIADNLYSLSLGGAVVAVEDRAITMIWTGITDVGAGDYWAATSYGGATQVPAPTGALALAILQYYWLGIRAKGGAGNAIVFATVASLAVMMCLAGALSGVEKRWKPLAGAALAGSIATSAPPFASASSKKARNTGSRQRSCAGCCSQISGSEATA